MSSHEGTRSSLETLYIMNTDFKYLSMDIYSYVPFMLLSYAAVSSISFQLYQGGL